MPSRVTGNLVKDWRALASCVGSPVEWFFYNEDEEDDTVDKYPEARKVCSVCPVRVECAQYAIVTKQRGGMWGGFSPRTRGRIRRRYNLGPSDKTTRSCLACGGSRLAGLFPESGLDVCTRCLYQPFDAGAMQGKEHKGRPRRIPSDDVLIAVFKSREANGGEPKLTVLAETWGVTNSTVTAHKRRLRNKGLL